ncbi:MAG: T9SS type A sorting domain-containing protein, partial [Bacteroidia bacterium]
GIFCIKGNTGGADVTIEGNFSLTNGTTFLHSNTTTPSSNTINLTVNGNFIHTGGSVNYDDNSASSGINNIYIKGAQYLLNGNGSITRSGAVISSVFGNIFFARAGTVSYQRTVSSHNIQQVKQIISTGCTLDVISGNLQVSSYTQPRNDLLKISPGGILKMNSAKIVSNTISAYSGITVDDNGRLMLEHSNGLYNGTDNACISSSGNMNYFLAPNSIVEYNGKTSQTLSGIGTGTATTTNHKYGKLEINLQGTTGVQLVILSTSNVFIRTNLLLTKGELKLCNNTLNIESGASTALTRQAGYINGETTTANNQGFLKWMHISNGTYIFPFGVSANEYIPFSFTPVSGSGDVQIATRATAADNLPYPEGGSLPSVTNVKRNGIDISNSSVMDRWYDIIANGFTANVTVSYRGIENTTADSLANAIFSIQSWDGTNWGPSAGSSIGVRSGTGTITATNVSSFNHWMIATKTDISNSSDILDFNAVLNAEKVAVNWSVNSANNTGNFLIERSAGQISFTEVGKVTSNGEMEELNSYTFNDLSPLEGISYYRLKRLTDDNRITYSGTAVINFKDEPQKDFAFISIFPNPFTDYIKVSYSVPVASGIRINLIGANGQIIYSEEINSIKGRNTYQFFEKQKLLPGIYVLSIRYGTSVISKKLFKS